MELDRAGRRRLRAALTARCPWLTDPEVGPTTVDAGTCDRCHELPRVVATCGPAPARTLCVECVAVVGAAGWCDGHRDVASRAVRWSAAAPPWWADAVVLWWIATGEVRPARGLLAEPSALPQVLRETLPGSWSNHQTSLRSPDVDETPWSVDSTD